MFHPRDHKCRLGRVSGPGGAPGPAPPKIHRQGLECLLRRQAKNRAGKRIQKTNILFRGLAILVLGWVEGVESSSTMGPEEQRMKMSSYAVLTLFFAVTKLSVNYSASRNGLRVIELHGIIRRSQRRVSEFTLLITLLPAKAL